MSLRLRGIRGDQLEGLADAILNKELNTRRYGKSREMDYVFQDDNLTMDNVDGVLERLGARTPVRINWGSDGSIEGFSGGNVLRNKFGGINLDQVPVPTGKDYTKYSPSVVDSETSELVRAQLYPELYGNATGQVAQARDMGFAHRYNDYQTYRDINKQMTVEPEVLDYLMQGGFSKNKADLPLGRSTFSKAGGIGTKAREQVLIPGTDIRFVDLPPEAQQGYLSDRGRQFLSQWLGQRGGSMGTAESVIFPPGKPSHMDHVQSLSSSIDTKGPGGWGFSDDPSNYSYLDKDYNVNTKLNYDLQTTHQLGRIADTLRQKGYGSTIPPNLTDTQLSDPNRVRLNQNDAIGELVAKTIPETADPEDLKVAITLLKQAEEEQKRWSGKGYWETFER